MKNERAPRFGSAPKGVRLHPRPAAYAVIWNGSGRVAAIRSSIEGEPKYWLPGGGLEGRETPEEAVVREVREELGRTVSLEGVVGEATQVFWAGSEDRWYDMKATFLRAQLGHALESAGDFELHWLDPQSDGELFYHECHKWASLACVPGAGDSVPPR